MDIALDTFGALDIKAGLYTQATCCTLLIVLYTRVLLFNHNFIQ